MSVRDDLRRLAQAGLTFDAPLSAERADGLVGALAISPGHHVVDLGCGWGELLLRMLAARPATTGTGVDRDRAALDRGRRLAAQRGLQERAEFVEADAASFDDRGDVVICVGASHVWSGPTASLRALRSRVDPGGLVLYGGGFWAKRPDAVARRAIGELPVFDGLLQSAQRAGFRIEQADRSTLTEWDSFEGSWRAALEASGDADAIAYAEERRQEYEDGYRDALGFAWLVLAPT